MMLDLLIHNANILDGTGAAAFKGDVAVKDGKIVEVGSCFHEAQKIIDASGLTLSPGWIDSHSHSDRTILSDPAQREKVEQGITFSITGQCGSSPAPVRRPDGIETAGQFLKRALPVAQGSGSALLVGHNAIRRAVMGEENRDPTAREMDQMCDLLREGLQAGAIGMSLGLYYIPGCYAKTEEIVALAKVVAEHSGLLAAHLRNEGATLLEAVREYLTIIEASGCRAVFSHHKSFMKENWGKVHQSLAMIDKAIADGADLYLDAYPYCATSTTLLARFMPAQFHPPGVRNVLSLLDDETIVRRICTWGESCWHNDLSWALITSCPSHPEYTGMNLNEISDLRSQPDRMRTALDLVRESNGGASAAFFLMCEEDVSLVLKHPRTMLCTDSATAAGNTFYHPRLRASFPRALGHYVRDEKLLPLPEMIRKMTSLPAHVYGLHTKGRIAAGMDADFCLFDPDTIADRADYAHCTAPNEGLHFVVISGQIVLENNRSNGIRAASLFLR